MPFPRPHRSRRAARRGDAIGPPGRPLTRTAPSPLVRRSATWIVPSVPVIRETSRKPKTRHSHDRGVRVVVAELRQDRLPRHRRGLEALVAEHHHPLLARARTEHVVALPHVAHRRRRLGRVQVAGIEDGVVGDGRELLREALVQRLRIAAGQVGAAAAVEEQRVAGRRACPSTKKHCEPGVCPGVCTSVIAMSPTSTRRPTRAGRGPSRTQPVTRFTPNASGACTCTFAATSSRPSSRRCLRC